MALPTPRISGSALRTLARTARTKPVRAMLASIVRKELGVDALRALPWELRSPLPLDAFPLRARASHARGSDELPLPEQKGFSGEKLAASYRNKEVTPEEIANRVMSGANGLLGAIPPSAPFLVLDEVGARNAARESGERWARGATLGPLDGIPIGIKEQTHVKGLPCQLGTSFLSRDACATDSTVVARLRAAGAVIIGTTMMTEYGMNPIGVSAKRVLPRNPHDPRRAAGGSSTGSAVAVAERLIVSALAADGGGSIRIPAAFCGVFGIKPTFGRVSRAGDEFGGTMNHLGPIAISTRDLTAFLEAIAGHDPEDSLTKHAPALADKELTRALGRGVKGLRIGIPDFEIAAADPAIAALVEDALRALEREGAVRVAVKVPLMRWAATIGYQTIGPESHASLRDACEKHLDELGPDLQLLMQILGALPLDAYLDSQRLRATLRKQVAEALANVDVIALPTTGCVAPFIDDVEARGFLDPPTLDAVSRYAYVGNLTGLPAGTAPIGKADGGPVGLQIIGDAWDEACVLQVLAHLERIGAARAERPSISVDVLT